MPDALERATPIEVIHFERLAAQGQHSMEMLAEDIRAAMPQDIHVKVHRNHFQRGILRRIGDTIAAWWSRGQVNHIIGDVHYLALLLPRRRTIVTVHDCGSLQRLRGLRRWLYWLFWFYLPLRRAARVTVVSEFTRRQLLNFVSLPPERITIIPTPISDAFQVQPMPPKGERPRLLQVGTRANKNLERVVAAVAGLDVELVIIGRLSRCQRALLRQHGIQYENHVDLTRDEVVKQYARSHAIVFVSTYEGFGMPIVEAQAMGRPVVTSDRSPMTETAGSAACFVDPTDVWDIRRGIERVLGDEHCVAQLVDAGSSNAELYTPHLVAEAYADMYRTLAK